MVPGGPGTTNPAFSTTTGVVEKVTVGRTGLVWDGVEHRWLSGEVHPWRLDPADWPAVLDAVQGLGFKMVSAYVPWVVHETAPGEYDFSGAKDIEAFLGLVHSRGMKAMVRIGPDCGAELETSGWPRRILDDEGCQARRPNGLPYLLVTATGHCFPPSYASKTVLREVRSWYDEVVPRLARLQHPHGPVVACQVDNEMGYHFQAHTYALDYHPDAVEQFRRFVGDPAAEPPTDGAVEPTRNHLDWVRFKEHHLRATIATFAGWARERGMDRVPIVHNDYPRLTSPQDLGALERTGAVDWAAADVYTTRHGGRFVRELARHLAGSTRLPFLAELGAGWLTLPWLLPLASTPYDEEVVHLRALLGGVRAANVYMLVERDRWHGSPVSRRGELRPKAALYPRLHKLLDDLRLEELERWAPVLLLENRDEARKAAARQTLGGIVPCFNQVMPLDPAATSLPSPHTDALHEAEEALKALLDGAGVDYDHATTTALPAPAEMAKYELVLIPLQTRPEDVAAVLPTPPVTRDDERVDLTIWHNDERLVVVAANSSEEDVTATLGFAFEGPAKLEGLWRAETVETDDRGQAVVTLAPFAVQVWEVRR